MTAATAALSGLLLIISTFICAMDSPPHISARILFVTSPALRLRVVVIFMSTDTGDPFAIVRTHASPEDQLEPIGYLVNAIATVMARLSPSVIFSPFFVASSSLIARAIILGESRGRRLSLSLD